MNIFDSLLDSLNTIPCPRCLEPLRSLKAWRDDTSQHFPCPTCSFPIPPAYLRDARKMSTVFVQLMGLTAVGKTTFLDMLRLQLYEMSKMWPGSYAVPVTQSDAQHRTILQTQRAQGSLAPGNTRRSRDQNEVYIMQLMKMERWNSHFLALMDFAGEQFDTLHIAVEDVPFLRHTPVTIMLLSLPDMPRQGRTMDELIINYVTTLKAHGVNFSRTPRQLIIVFNKADLIPNLPTMVNDYLQSDQIYTLMRNNKQVPDMRGEQLYAYIKQMGQISHMLKNWVEGSVQGGASALNHLQDKKIGVRFTVMSATGHDLSGSTGGLKPVPRRVLDPFFWVMESSLIAP